MTDQLKETGFYHTRIKEWPEEERPREKLLKYGSRALSDAELLAILIGSGTHGITAVDLAKRLLIDFGGLKSVACSGIAELVRMKGIGDAGGAKICAAFEIGRRIESHREKKKEKLDAPEIVARIYLPRMRNLKKEIFMVILLDNGNKLIRDIILTQGTLNASLVHPREVFKAAVDYLAAGVILVHNHPSGETVPSRDDRRVTDQMVRAGEIIGIPVIDHIILAGSGYFSFAEAGILGKDA